MGHYLLQWFTLIAAVAVAGFDNRVLVFNYLPLAAASSRRLLG